VSGQTVSGATDVLNVAGVLVNMVPYHHARWEAFAQQERVQCQVIELTERDAFKVLEFSAAATYQRHTLLVSGGRDRIPRRLLQSKLGARLDAVRPDVVCVSGWAQPVSLAAHQWALSKAVPVVMLSESNQYDRPRFAVREYLKRRVVGLCAAGLAGGNTQAEYLARLGLPRQQVFLGYDAVNNGDFAAGAVEARRRASLLRQELGLPRRFFLASARFSRKKNLGRLLEAYARYRQMAETPETAASKAAAGRQADEPWDLVLLGDGPLRDELFARCSTPGLNAHAHLVGARPYAALPSYYGLASAFVHASTTEQWGLVVNEAMASGLPVLVSSRCGCAPTLVQEGVNGFTFDPRNVGQLAGLMVKVSRCDFPLSAFGEASRRIIADWGPERFASGLKAAVECALRVGAPRARLLDRLILKALSLRRWPVGNAKAPDTAWPEYFTPGWKG
jgi:1,2-diacylglycerol 3-alpha-glucosyltransferase